MLDAVLVQRAPTNSIVSPYTCLWQAPQYSVTKVEAGAALQVLIQDGELRTGTLCKKTLGASGGSLIHVIWMEEGPEAARGFLSQCQYLVNHWLLQHGFSVGIGDTVADSGTMGIISETIQKVRSIPERRCSILSRTFDSMLYF